MTQRFGQAVIAAVFLNVGGPFADGAAGVVPFIGTIWPWTGTQTPGQAAA